MNEPPLNGLIQVHNYTILSGERFFGAALKNSHFCTSHVESNLRHISWAPGLKQGCHANRPSIDWFGCSPIALQMNYWKQIENNKSKNNVFLARKFDSTIDMTVLNEIDKYIYGINVPNRFWINIWHKR